MGPQLQPQSTLVGSLLAVVVAVSACSDLEPTSPDQTSPQPADGTPQFTLGSIPENDPDNPPPFSTRGEADFEFVEVCKEYVDGGPMPTVAIEVSVVSHQDGQQTPFAIELDDGECLDVWLHGGDGLDEVTVTEAVPADYISSYVVEVANSENPGCQEARGPTEGNSTTVLAGGAECGLTGALVRFTNTFDPPPPPPGGEGCTPGYWKNHAGVHSHSKGGQKKPSAWEGYDPTDSYDTTFGVTSSFGGTLIDALTRGGGGEKALGRHAVAALLDAAHSGVDYDLTEAEVISAVQAAYSSGDFETTKDMLGALNEQGCPL